MTANPATLLVNCPIRGIMSILRRTPISPNDNDEYYEALVENQKRIRTIILLDITI